MCFAGLTVLECVILILTPAERLRAAGRLDARGGTVNPFFFIAGGAIIIAVLTILLVITSFKSTGKKSKRKDSYLLVQAKKRGLTERELQILIHIAGLAGLRNAESIFTMSNAFDIGVARLTGPDSVMNLTAEQNRQLMQELSYLREKLGFRKYTISANKPAVQSKEQSSREISVGKTLHMTRRLNNNTEDIEASVVKTDDAELTVKTAVTLSSNAGEKWRVRYYYGASVWEFDVSVISCDGDNLVLTHSDEIRFINRRRFLRVAVYKKAYVAPFSFERQVQINDEEKGLSNEQGTFDKGEALPKFVPGTVTELAGPGLRIETPMEFDVGQRVAVIFDLGTYDEDDDKPVKNIQTTEIVEDIGIVRHVRSTDNGWSIAVELTGLSDANVDKLVRMTNAEAVKANSNGNDSEESKTQENENVETLKVESD